MEKEQKRSEFGILIEELLKPLYPDWVKKNGYYPPLVEYESREIVVVEDIDRLYRRIGLCDNGTIVERREVVIILPRYDDWLRSTLTITYEKGCSPVVEELRYSIGGRQSRIPLTDEMFNTFESQIAHLQSVTSMEGWCDPDTSIMRFFYDGSHLPTAC